MSSDSTQRAQETGSGPSDTVRTEKAPLPQQLTRQNVPALDALLGTPIKVLDDGFVRVIDYLGSDASIVQAARVSYGEGTKQLHEDRGLVRYLMRNLHTTPFEMCELKLHVRVPMDCWRQWIRHRTANVNEYSTRYSIAIDAAQHTKSNEWRLQSGSNRQGSMNFFPIEEGEKLSNEEREFHLRSREIYDSRILSGVAREQARKDLPLSTYTEAYWKIDLHNLLHFLVLRMDSHAQAEIRQYANVIGYEIVAKWCPIAWEAFVDYRVNSINLTDPEISILAQIARNQNANAIDEAKRRGLLSYGPNGLQPNRERQELEAKLARLGLGVPWKSDK